MDGSERVSWCSQQDLNLRPWAYEAPALTAMLWELVWKIARASCKGVNRHNHDDEYQGRYVYNHVVVIERPTLPCCHSYDLLVLDLPPVLAPWHRRLTSCVYV